MEGEVETGVTFEKKQRAKQPFRARKRMIMGGDEAVNYRLIDTVMSRRSDGVAA